MRQLMIRSMNLLLVAAVLVCYQCAALSRIVVVDAHEREAAAAAALRAEYEQEAQVVQESHSAQEESRGPYQDGEWQGSAQGFGGDIAVRVTVSGGYVEDIAVLSAEGEDPAYFAEAETLLPELIAAQGGAVDTVSGATFSSTGLINAVANALEGAR